MNTPSPQLAVRRRPARSQARRRRAYTLVEVMMALAVLTVGAAGIVAMQKTSLISSLQARHLSSGMNVNVGWLDQLSVEALAWNEPTNIDLTDMFTLGPRVAWNTLSAGSPSSPWFNLGARSIDGDPIVLPSGDPVAYCTHARVTWLGNPLIADTLRVELRTFWAKQGRPINGECAVAPATWTTHLDGGSGSISIDGINRHRHEYGFAYATGVLRRRDQ